MKKLRNIYVLFFFMVNFLSQVYGQFLPKDGAKLNYNQIYFEYPYHPQAINYKLYLAIDSNANKNDFKFLINIYTDATPALKVSDLAFGKNFKWYVETVLKTGEKQKSDIHYFSTYNCVYADTAKYKTKQYYNKKEKIIDGLLWCDHMHSVLDRKGKVVWFIAPINDDFKEGRQIRNFRLLNDGSITFLSEPEAYHVDRDLTVIWKGPNDGKVSETKKESYHHSLERMGNGNYMVLGNEVLELERSDSKDTSSGKADLTTLIEYDPQGNVIWSWRMRDYFPLDLLASKDGKSISNPHCNSFSLDKNGRYIYVGFRDLSRIIKIDKKSKNIVASYGEKLNKSDTSVIQTDIFRKPHDAYLLDDNKMIVLNNNDIKSGKPSSTEIFNLPSNETKNLTPIWSFKFNFDSINDGKSVKLGGNKILSNGNILINEGLINRIIEVSKQKEVLWDLMIFKRDAVGNWSNFPSYRVDFSTSLYPYLFTVGIENRTKKDLDLVVFNEGDYADTYIYEMYDVEGKLIISQNLGSINPLSKKTVKILLNVKTAKKLRIHSSKSGLSREISLN